MPTRLRSLRPWLEPAVGAMFFALWCVAEAGRFRGNSIVVTLALVAVAIAISRIRPVVSLALIVGVVTLQVLQVLSVLASTTWPIALGILFVVFTVALDAPKPVSLIALSLGLPLSAASGYLIGLGFNSWVGAGAARNQLEMWLMVSALSLGLYAGAWAIGFALRVSLRELRALMLLRTTTAQLDDIEMELTLTRERDRIARDVHDVLAHSLAVVIAQADGARFASTARPEITDDALQAIAGAARSALVDVRTLVEGLREEDGDQPQPGLDDLDPLLGQLRNAGMSVDAEHFGRPSAMTPAQQLAVYRIVQESLTNALRHAGRHASARISYDWRGPGLALTVASSGNGEAGGPLGAGHGIRGMKDRARLAGGWLTAEPDGDDFLVTAFLPTAREKLPAGARLELAE